MISACIITKNEERHIEECLSKLQWVDEIILLDSGSRDATVALAKKYNAQVFYRPFDTFSKQKNACMEKATGNWILLVDADEYIGEALASEIIQTVENTKYNGFWIPRTVRWLGSPLSHGGLQNEKLIRLIRKGMGTYYRDVHEEMRVEGSCGILKNPMLHNTTPTMEDYIRKHRHYLILDVRMRLATQKIPSLAKVWIWPSILFIRRYIFQGGFLDGITGLRYQLCSAHFVWAKYIVTRRILLKRLRPLRAITPNNGV